MTSRFATAIAALLLAPASASAAEVQFDGAYQMRGRLFDTLSLDRELDISEGLSWYVQHRLWFRPKFLLSDQVGLFVDIRALDNLVWGQSPQGYDDFAGLETSSFFAEDLTATTGDDSLRIPGIDMTLWHAWGEVHTKVGTFRFGRMPIHWGKGLWQNDGMGRNQDYGDTADRISWEHVVADVWVRLGADIHTEGLINQTDDTTGFHAAVAYRTERIDGGVNFMYRHANAEGTKFDLFIVSGAFDLELGIIGVEGEVVGQFGSGDLPGGLDDIRVAAAGAVIDLSLDLDKLQVHVEGGLATGDGSPDDTSYRTFAFDRDYNVGLFMFEQPMPLFTSAVAGEARSFDDTISGNSVSNALYLRPSVAYELVPGFALEANLLAARAARVPEELRDQDRNSYGFEFGLGARYTGIEFLDVEGRFGAFIPGNTFRNFQDENFTGFRSAAFGGQLLTRIAF